jgi:hypothetical protein
LRILQTGIEESFINWLVKINSCISHTPCIYIYVYSVINLFLFPLPLKLSYSFDISFVFFSYFTYSPTPLFLYSFPPIPCVFHPSYFSSVFIQYFSPFLPSVISLHPFQLFLSLLVAHSAPSFLSFHPNLFSLSSFPHLNISIIFLSFALSLPSCSGISCVIHLSYFLLYLDSLILSLLFCLSVSLFLSFSSTCIHLPFALNLYTSSLIVYFSLLLLRVFSQLSRIPSVSCTLPFLPFCLQTLGALFPAFTLSLFLLHSSLTT